MNPTIASCPAHGQLVDDLLTGRLPLDDAIDAERTIESCQACRSALRTMEAATPELVADAVATSFEQFRRPKAGHGRVAVAAAVVLALGAGFGLQVQETDEPEPTVEVTAQPEPAPDVLFADGFESGNLSNWQTN